MVYTLTLDALVAGGQFSQLGEVYLDPGGDLEINLSGLKGWWDSPAPVTARTPRRNASGQFRAAAYRGGRSVAIEVTCTSTSGNDLNVRLWEQKIAALCNNPALLYPLAVQDATGTWVAYVELDGAIVHVMRGGLAWSTVASIPVASPDNRRFAQGWTAVLAGSARAQSGGIVSTGTGIVSTGSGIVSGIAAGYPVATVTGLGTAVNPVVFKLTGVATNVLIADALGASQVYYNGNLGPTDTVWINTDSQPAYDLPGAPGPIPARGAVLNDNSNARSAVTIRGGWPVLSPGAIRTFLLSGGLGAGVSLTVYARGALA